VPVRILFGTANEMLDIKFHKTPGGEVIRTKYMQPDWALPASPL